MTYTDILFEVDGAVAVITLNRPEKLNACSEQMKKDLTHAIARVETDKSIRCLVLTGAGRAFCPGQDLTERVTRADGSRPNLYETITEGYYPFLKPLMNMDIPTVCAVNGVAAGAGANLALACDIVIAADTAKFIQLFSNIGLIPDCGGTWILPRLVGLARAKALCMTAEPVLAADAVNMGMIYKAVPAESLMDEAMKLAQYLAARPTVGLAKTKKILEVALNNDRDTQLELEAVIQQQCGETHDYAEGVMAFAQKRAPQFKGC